MTYRSKKKAAKKRRPKTTKKAIRRNPNIPRPHNGGEWTEARFQSFIKSALRRAQWPPKFKALQDAFVKEGINPDTGRKCKLSRCAHCEGLFPQSKLSVDHIDPVIPVTGFDSWDAVIKRLFCEKQGLQALCSQCHDLKTSEEKEHRKKYKQQNTQ